ncbi:MAG TPA: hypothetical protein VFI08_01880 [Spirochaetia bacterium]|nr:hypothetical protein [Spirochaetia bacterium]
MFNFGPQAGKTEDVDREEFRIRDLRKARLIGLYLALIGIAVAIARVVVPV